ncbi:MAG: glycosyltransferase family 4 protein [Dermatophilaceae bacterium]
MPESLNKKLETLREDFSMQSLADALHMSRKSLAQHLDKRFGKLHGSAPAGASIDESGDQGERVYDGDAEMVDEPAEWSDEDAEMVDEPAEWSDEDAEMVDELAQVSGGEAGPVDEDVRMFDGISDPQIRTPVVSGWVEAVGEARAGLDAVLGKAPERLSPEQQEELVARGEPVPDPLHPRQRWAEQQVSQRFRVGLFIEGGPDTAESARHREVSARFDELVDVVAASYRPGDSDAEQEARARALVDRWGPQLGLLPARGLRGGAPGGQHRSDRPSGTSSSGDPGPSRQPGEQLDVDPADDTSAISEPSAQAPHGGRNRVDPASGDDGGFVSSGSDIGRKKILVLSDVSGRGLGGVPVVTMQLVRGLAATHDVTVVTADPQSQWHLGPDGTPSVRKTAEEQHAWQLGKEQEHGDARFINVTADVWAEPRDNLAQFAASTSSDLRRAGLGTDYDVVIGHMRFSGPAASTIRDSHVPNARFVLVLHTSPVRLDVLKGQPGEAGEKSTIEREVMKDADLVVGVGGLLADEAARLSQQIGRQASVHELIPGAELGLEVHRRERPPGSPVRLLLPGRANDVIKGVHPAIMAVGVVNQGRPGSVHLTVRGAPPVGTPGFDAVQDVIDRHAPGAVTLLPFTTSAAELAEDRRTTDAVIMPSLHEGFGLVATEAAGSGIPVLVNNESGAARFLRQLPGGENAVVHSPVTAGDPDNERDRVQAWAQAIEDLDVNLESRWAAASELRGALVDYSWAHAGASMIEAALRTGAPQRDRPAWQRSGMGEITRQGPRAGVIQENARTPWEPAPHWDGTTPEPPRGRVESTEQQQERARDLERRLHLITADDAARGSTDTDTDSSSDTEPDTDSSSDTASAPW